MYGGQGRTNTCAAARGDKSAMPVVHCPDKHTHAVAMNQRLTKVSDAVELHDVWQLSNSSMPTVDGELHFISSTKKQTLAYRKGHYKHSFILRANCTCR